MNSCCCSFVSWWMWSGRWVWLLQLDPPICSSFYCCLCLTHKPVHFLWLSQKCVAVEHAELLVSCVCAWVETWAHHWLHHGLVDVYLTLALIWKLTSGIATCFIQFWFVSIWCIQGSRLQMLQGQEYPILLV
jgi:hypothetical protein